MRGSSPRLAVFFANAGHTLTHLLMLLYPTVVLALEGRFGLSYGELMLLALPGTILYGAGALPAGWLGDRWSAEHMMVLFYLGSGGAALATGLATGPLGIGVGLGLLGLFGSIYHPVGIAWLVRNAENRGKVLGWNGIFGTAGVGIAPATAGFLTEYIDWRAAFILPGIICLAMGVVLLLAVRSGAVVAARTDLRPQPEPARGDVVRAFVALSVTMLAAGIIYQALTVALPKLFEQRLVALTAGSPLGAGGFASLVFAEGMVFPLLGGWLSDRYSLKGVYVLSWAVAVPALLLSMRWVELPLFGSIVVVFSLMSMVAPAENALLVRYTPGRWRATAFGAKFMLSLGVSALGLPLVAFIFDRSGDFAWLFVVLAALAMVIVAAALFLPREGRARAALPVTAPAE
ncbi:MAG TPA: MFS transporter [Stellaceae bacterium]|nr:MFS transporter [Stellaceae bacterium]